MNARTSSLPTNEGTSFGSCAGPTGVLTGSPGEHACLQRPQLEPGLHPQLDDEHVPRRAVGGERFCPPSDLVQGGDVQQVRPFPQRVGADQLGELADDRGGPALGQLGGVAVLLGGEPPLRQAGGLVGEQGDVQPLVRVALPQLERFPQRRGPPVGHEPFEPGRVHLVDVGPQPVAVGVEGEPVGVVERAAQAVHVELQALRAAGVRCAPHGLDQDVHGHGGVHACEKDTQQDRLHPPGSRRESRPPAATAASSVTRSTSGCSTTAARRASSTWSACTTRWTPTAGGRTPSRAASAVADRVVGRACHARPTLACRAGPPAGWGTSPGIAGERG
ncbi:hypothetical protein H4W32_007672 [Actinophytocola algeriensis]|uniref:Uncharacterized protein n=1 Tax=Actinophytocola algeriensis TaxID=1768010 RepID=A0A7W7Q5U4_9PSEU|nr:hypothetical protein [Actinophytocola algeriensis]MBE1479630.1 hypothetical protein [Actinophytocola algeriensis]